MSSIIEFWTDLSTAEKVGVLAFVLFVALMLMGQSADYKQCVIDKMRVGYTHIDAQDDCDIDER